MHNMRLPDGHYPPAWEQSGFAGFPVCGCDESDKHNTGKASPSVPPVTDPSRDRTMSRATRTMMMWRFDSTHHSKLHHWKSLPVSATGRRSSFRTWMRPWRGSRTGHMVSAGPVDDASPENVWKRSPMRHSVSSARRDGPHDPKVVSAANDVWARKERTDEARETELLYTEAFKGQEEHVPLIASPLSFWVWSTLQEPGALKRLSPLQGTLTSKNEGRPPSLWSTSSSSEALRTVPSSPDSTPQEKLSDRDVPRCFSSPHRPAVTIGREASWR